MLWLFLNNDTGTPSWVFGLPSKDSPPRPQSPNRYVLHLTKSVILCVMDKRNLTPAPPSALDAHGFDPNDFDWLPVPRQPRADGWSPDAQRRFIEALDRKNVG